LGSYSFYPSALVKEVRLLAAQLAQELTSRGSDDSLLTLLAGVEPSVDRPVRTDFLVQHLDRPPSIGQARLKTPYHHDEGSDERR
jgi:hypothetical protein